MRAMASLMILALAGAGCGGGENPAAPPPESEVSPPAADMPEDVMENIEMHLFPTSDVSGEGVKPLLSIRAKRVTGNMGGDIAELSFEGAQAMVPQQKPEDAQIYFEAASGTFQESKRAMLSGGVTAQVDDMNISLEEITWEILPPEGTAGETGMAFSDKPLKIASPTQNLEAARLRLYPDTQVMELYDVTGVINFKGVTP